ncbi:MAG TPA: NAD-dependent succinate-semialdehyde dehydrogenase [Acidobacteriota bacterium]|nr:NAD-dependent succinate-semialdehyde dehydrogenase [Acidobacteriota bacterium]
MASVRSLIQSINPATEEVLREFETHSDADTRNALDMASRTYVGWRTISFAHRSELMLKAADCLRRKKPHLAATITAEMGKPIAESEAEVEKCAWNCEYFAENAEGFLRDEVRTSNARESYIQFTPLGTILAVMPWNFPFWQVFRFAAPALMAGNTAILKHASNVPQCALAIEDVFREAGFPEGAFRTLLVPSPLVRGLIRDPVIAAVTLTGSEAAGSSVASEAGRCLKKTVLELGGSDPFIVLEDADLDAAVSAGVRARYQNTGQSCIAAKRFIVVEPVFAEFQERFVEAVRGLKVGNPMERATQIGPLARNDLIDGLERQVQESVQQGARLVFGGKRIPGRGYFFEPTVLTDARIGIPATCEEVFGPVAAMMKAKDATEAVQIANTSPYGLGSNLWTSDLETARRLARKIEAGQVFVNGMVASDPRLPFGGIKRSGYGRELSEFGIREFVNIQTVWIGPSSSSGPSHAH